MNSPIDMAASFNAAQTCVVGSAPGLKRMICAPPSSPLRKLKLPSRYAAVQEPEDDDSSIQLQAPAATTNVKSNRNPLSRFRRSPRGNSSGTGSVEASSSHTHSTQGSRSNASANTLRRGPSLYNALIDDESAHGATNKGAHDADDVSVEQGGLLDHNQDSVSSLEDSLDAPSLHSHHARSFSISNSMHSMLSQGSAHKPSTRSYCDDDDDDDSEDDLSFADLQRFKATTGGKRSSPRRTPQSYDSDDDDSSDSSWASNDSCDSIELRASQSSLRRTGSESANSLKHMINTSPQARQQKMLYPQRAYPSPSKNRSSLSRRMLPPAFRGGKGIQKKCQGSLLNANKSCDPVWIKSRDGRRRHLELDLNNPAQQRI